MSVVPDLNPYAAPDTIASAAAVPTSLGGYTPAQVRKLYYRSCNVNAIAALMILGCLLAGVALLMAFIPSARQANPGPMRAGVAVMLALLLMATVAVVRRSSWGRIAGIGMCPLMMLKVPIGTVFGIVGLFAFFMAGELFGHGRITHRELTCACKEMKERSVVGFPTWTEGRA